MIEKLIQNLSLTQLKKHYKHYKKYRNLYKEDYNYVPETYILLDDVNEFLIIIKIIFLILYFKNQVIIKPIEEE